MALNAVAKTPAGGLAIPGHGPASALEGQHPQVSILIPTYNTSHYIATTLDSVFSQTFKSFETIVVNDGSPDTPELERVLEPYMGRIIYVEQKNAGPAAARNRGIRHARGQFFAFLDSDDAWFPCFLESQMKLFDQVPTPDLVYADLMKVTELRPKTGHVMKYWSTQGSATFEDLLTQDRTFVVLSSAVVRRQAAIDAGLFDERLRCDDDYDLWLRIAHQGGRIRYQRRVLGQRLIRPTSLTADLDTHLPTACSILHKLDRELQLTPERRKLAKEKAAQLQADYEAACGRRLVLEGKFKEAERLIREAAAHSKGFSPRLLATALHISPRPTRVLLWAWTSFRARAKRFVFIALAYALSW